MANSVLEGLPLTGKGKNEVYHSNSQTSQNDFLITPRRILGTAPIEKDGSFHVRVPAEIPVNFQLLDENYMAIKKQEAWTWVMGNENRGCIGCHEDRELSPPNILVDAVTKPAVDFSKTPEKWKMVDFRHQIAPIVEAKCAIENCHAGGNVSPDLKQNQGIDKTTSSRGVFEQLLKITEGSDKNEFVNPGSARESPLIGHLFGGQIPVEITEELKNINPLPPDKQLTEDEKMLFIEWIDTGAFWDLSLFKINSSQNN